FDLVAASPLPNANLSDFRHADSASKHAPSARWVALTDTFDNPAQRRTIEGRDIVMRSLIQAVYRFRDATLVAEKKDDFGNALQNLYRELERAEDLVGPGA
ncbi:MAG TPA: hypothetical protein VN857_05960, partial [Chthoniobacterales bacterium]|nr:hypothetical protein [Chthoniobacterales bacterium]